MDEKAVTGSPWSMKGTHVHLCAGALSAELDVARPYSGLLAVSLGGHKPTAEVLCIYRSADATLRHVAPTGGKPDWPLPVADAYVRGNDLVATYAPIDTWPFSPQVYWRANTLSDVPAVLGSVSLLASVQTHLLDTWPRIGVRSGLACGEMFHVTSSNGRVQRAETVNGIHQFTGSADMCCIVFRLYDAPLSYIEIMLANDYCDIKARKLETVGGEVEWELFSEFLEKGVIRRARLHSAFVPRENDLEVAAACCAAAQRSELPLTT